MRDDDISVTFCAAASAVSGVKAAQSSNSRLTIRKKNAHAAEHNKLCYKSSTEQHHDEVAWYFAFCSKKLKTSGFCAHSSSPGEGMQGSYEADDVLPGRAAPPRPEEIRDNPHWTG